MNYLVTESQLNLLLREINDKNLSSSMMKLYDFSKNIIHQTIRKYKINVSFLLKFGTAIGGLVVPLDNYIKNKNLNLSDSQISLVLIGVVMTYFFEHSDKLGKILLKIQEEGLFDLFKECLGKSIELKKAFSGFLSSLDTTIDTATEMVSYSFLIPVITDIISMSQSSSNVAETSLIITERLISSGVVIVGGMALKELMKKIVARLKG